MCAALVVRAAQPRGRGGVSGSAEALGGQVQPWVAGAGEDGLVLDVTGCTHLFGGEAALMEAAGCDCAEMGLSVQMGLADTLGAAWALARYAGEEAASDRSGDAIEQEARATRARAQKRTPRQSAKRRHWTRGGAAPQVQAPPAQTGRIAEPGQAYGALGPLPVAARCGWTRPRWRS